MRWHSSLSPFETSELEALARDRGSRVGCGAHHRLGDLSRERLLRPVGGAEGPEGVALLSGVQELDPAGGFLVDYLEVRYLEEVDDRAVAGGRKPCSRPMTM